MATAKLFPREDDFDGLIKPIALKYAVEPELIKAFIALESNFNPAASRAEPQLKPRLDVPGLGKGGDKSYGLMQVLYRTAWDLGYRGRAEGLFDPETSIKLGTRFIADNVRAAKARRWGLDSAISAYNAGGSADRPGDGKRRTTAKDGKINGVLAPFVNQAYVNRVLAYYSHFKIRTAEARAAPSPNNPPGPASEVKTSDQAEAVPEPRPQLKLPLTPPVISTGVPTARPVPFIVSPVRKMEASGLALLFGVLVVLIAVSLTNQD